MQTRVVCKFCTSKTDRKSISGIIKPKKSKGYWQKQENLKAFVTELKQNENLNTPGDWNLITTKQIKKNGGSTLLKHYSLYDIKKLGCPEENFQFDAPRIKKSTGYWNIQCNIDQFLLELKEIKNLKTFKDWDSLTKREIDKYGGSCLLKQFSMYEIKCMGFPEGKNKFKRSIKPEKHWENKENLILFLNELKNDLNLKTPKDWNSITQKHIHKYGGSNLLKKYSIFEIKTFGCPEGKLEFDKPRKSIGYWENHDNINEFLNKLAENLNFKTPEDWNLLTVKQIKQFGGRNLLHSYSLYDIQCLACPDHVNLFKPSIIKKEIGYWNDINNVHKFLDKLKNNLNLSSFDDWNSITQKDIHNNGGSNLLKQYSLYEIKCLGYPKGKFDFYQKKTSGFWNNKENIQNFLDDLKKEYNLNTPEDWKRISTSQIVSLGGGNLLSMYTKDEILQSQILDDKSNESYSLHSNNKSSSRSSQRWLFLQVQKLFPDDEIVEDYYHSEISRETGYAVQFDVFLVKKKIAFEYHGKQHYEEIAGIFAPIELYKLRDTEKKKLCQQHGVHLIVIPYWWDNKMDSLKKSINENL